MHYLLAKSLFKMCYHANQAPIVNLVDDDEDDQKKRRLEEEEKQLEQAMAASILDSHAQPSCDEWQVCVCVCVCECVFMYACTRNVCMYV